MHLFIYFFYKMKLFKTGLVLIDHDTKQEQMPQETWRGQEIVINMY